MNMIDKIKLLMEERNLSKADLSKGADIPYTTIDGWFKKGCENVRFPTLKKLASFFDVSMEYLINDDEVDRDYGKVTSFNFNRDEQFLISLWRKLPHDDQLKMIGRIEAIIEDRSR